MGEGIWGGMGGVFMGMMLRVLVDGMGLKEEIEGDVWVEDVVIDPKAVGPGILFIARRGWYYDTHTVLGEVLERGAVGLVVSRYEMVPEGCRVPCYVAEADDPLLGWVSARFFGYPTRQLRVFGVTGTNGKTTTAHVLAHALRAMGETTAVMGTVGYDLGDGRVKTASNTTPDAIVIQRFARDALEAGATALVMEVSSHALAIGRVAGVLFDAVGFTNLTHDHLDFHKTIEAYAQAKQKLFGELLDDALTAKKIPGAVVCVDQPWGVWMLGAAAPNIKRLTVSATGQAAPENLHHVPHWTGHIEQHTLLGLQGAITSSAGERWPFQAPLVGLYNLENILVALGMLALTVQDGAQMRDAFASLASLPSVPGRLQRAFEPRDGEPLVLVDHAHTPDAIQNVLTMIHAIQDKPITVVLGCGGDRDPTKRAPMASIACALAESVFLTSDNPRSEDPQAILDAMVLGVPANAMTKTHVIVEREHAIDAALRAARGPVLLLGKGHEDYQEIKGIKHPYSDVTCAQHVIQTLRSERRWQLPLRRSVTTTTTDSTSFASIDITNILEIPLKPHPGAFGVLRKHHRHEGVDLYATEGEAVYAVESGVVVAVEDFTGPKAGSPWWLDTQSVLIEGAVGVVCYGEIIASVKVGDAVIAGQLIGYITPVLRTDKGRPRSMLHLELYTHGTTTSVAWEQEEKPHNLCDPTAWLLDKDALHAA